jgi:hypothetical protein
MRHDIELFVHAPHGASRRRHDGASREYDCLVDRANEVLAECAANPDDDAPRLVWADLVGGERGELVVLQCDLARGAISTARRARERELLDRNGIAWAGSLPRIASRWSFRRGFIEAAKLARWRFDPETLREHPLVSTLTVDRWAFGDWENVMPHVAHLRGLDLSWQYWNPGAFSVLDRFHALRAFGCADLAPAHLPYVLRLVKRCPIERLRLHAHRLDRAQLDELAAAAPNARIDDAAVDLCVVGTECAEISTLAFIVRVDRSEIFELPPTPGDEWLDIGRGRTANVRLQTGTVARMHARVGWHAGRHSIRDLQSTNGILYEGRRVEEMNLTDGDELVLGDATIRYFVGDGARERAERAARRP